MLGAFLPETVRTQLLPVGLLLGLLPPQGLHAAAQPAPDNQPRTAGRQLVYGGDAFFPPYEYLDDAGQPRGFNVELIRLLARETGLDLQIQLRPWKRTMDLLDAGRLDLVSLAHTDARAKRYEFLFQTWTLHRGFLFRAGRASYPRSLDELTGETVVVEERGSIHELLLELPAARRPPLRVAPNHLEACRILARGEATLAAGSLLTLQHLARQLGLNDAVAIDIRAYPYFLVTQKGRAAEFASLQAAFEKVRHTQAYHTLVERSLVLPVPPRTWRDYARYLAPLLAVIVALSVGSFAWNRSLREQVSARTRQLSGSLDEQERLARALRESERRFRGMVEGLNLGVVLIAPDGRVLFANRAGGDILGVPPESLVGRSDLLGDAVQEDGTPFPPAAHPIQAVLASRQPVSGLVLGVKRGERQARAWLLVTLQPELSPERGLEQLIVSFSDVTEARSLREERERFFDLSPTLFLMLARDGTVKQLNPAWELVLGYRASDLVGRKIQEFVHFADLEIARAEGRRLRTGGISGLEIRLRHADGSLRWLLWNATFVPEQDTIYGVALDVTERRIAQEQIHHLAYHDSLTGLPNRELFLDRLNVALAHALRHRSGLAVLFIDLDSFKVINDSLGHPIGDKLLQAVAGRIRQCLREEDSVARMGGDEFTALIAGISAATDVSKIAQKLQHAIKQPIVVDGRELSVSASIGIGLYPNDGESPAALLKNADTAMYRAKELGRDNYQFYTAAMSARVIEHLNLEGRLRRALAQDQLLLYYQPVVCLDSGRVHKVEALLRWRDPERDIVTPADFLALAEVTGLIVEIGSFVLNTACREIGGCDRSGALHIAVNLSARQFHHAEVVDQVKQALADTGFDPARLELEITETVAMQDQERTVETLKRLKELGVSLAIDDFGTGYSSLSYLRRFPLDTLKIDRSFVHDIDTDQGAAGIATAIIAMGRRLGLRVVAEGVETPAQFAFLKQHGCHDAQGFLFSRPVPISELFGRIEDATRELSAH
jgi:diguanylate cyclase (GGDEF)-like protein/PAS domain S-box-containing protein